MRALQGLTLAGVALVAACAGPSDADLPARVAFADDGVTLQWDGARPDCFVRRRYFTLAPPREDGYGWAPFFGVHCPGGHTIRGIDVEVAYPGYEFDDFGTILADPQGGPGLRGLRPLIRPEGFAGRALVRVEMAMEGPPEGRVVGYYGDMPAASGFDGGRVVRLDRGDEFVPP